MSLLANTTVGIEVITLGKIIQCTQWRKGRSEVCDTDENFKLRSFAVVFRLFKWLGVSLVIRCARHLYTDIHMRCSKSSTEPGRVSTFLRKAASDDELHARQLRSHISCM